MAINLRSAVVENREQRLGTIIAWDEGSAAEASPFASVEPGFAAAA